MSRVYTLIKNIISNFSTQLLTLLVTFFAIPIIYNKFGINQYGLLVLLNTITIFLTIFDFGLIPSFIKHVAEFNSNKQNLSKLINAAFSSYLFLVSLCSIILYLISPTLIYNYLKIPLELKHTALILLRLLTVNFFLSALTTFFSSFTQAFHRFDLFNIKNICWGILVPISTIILINLGGSLVELAYLYIVMNFLLIIFYYLLMKKLCPENFSLKLSVHIPELKRIYSFGWFKFVSALCTRVVNQLNEFIISSYLPIKFVSYYSIPTSIAQKIVEILPNITGPLFPLSAELFAQSLKDKLTKLFITSIKLTNVILMPITCFIVINSYSILSLWIDEGFAQQAYVVLQILCAAYLITSFTGIPSATIEGMGKSKITAYFGLFSAVTYLILAFILIPKYGVNGAAFAVLVNASIQTPFFVFFVINKILKIAFVPLYWLIYIKPLTIYLLTLIPFLFLPRVYNLWQLGFTFFIYFIICILLSFLFRIIDDNDRIILYQLLRKIFSTH